MSHGPRSTTLDSPVATSMISSVKLPPCARCTAAIDIPSGGGVDGFLASLNKLLAIAVPNYLQEGGTYVIPGHGRISDEADVVEYRDMVTIVRARIAALAAKGSPLAQVKAARPTLDYDARYGDGGNGWTPDKFIEAIYQNVSKRK